MQLSAVILSLGLLLFVQGSSAESFIEFFFKMRLNPSSPVSKSMQIAEKSMDRIGSVLQEASGFVLFLPIDSAWDSKPGAFQAILNEEGGDVRLGMLKAVYVDIPLSESKSWSSVQAYAQRIGGVLGSADGLAYLPSVGQRVCLLEQINGNYVNDGCASIVGSPVVLSDATVYLVDSLLVPAKLKNSLQSLARISQEFLAA